MKNTNAVLNTKEALAQAITEAMEDEAFVESFFKCQTESDILSFFRCSGIETKEEIVHALFEDGQKFALEAGSFSDDELAIEDLESVAGGAKWSRSRTAKQVQHGVCVGIGVAAAGLACGALGIAVGPVAVAVIGFGAAFAAVHG